MSGAATAATALSVRVQQEDFDIGLETNALRQRSSGPTGGIAAFIGTVRDVHADAAVEALEIEHYPGMTERGITAMTMAIADRFGLNAATVIHRIGRLSAGSQIVLVLTAAPHRAAALDACTALMDYLKTDAVFWKREIGADGARWVEALASDRIARARWDDDA